MTKPILYRDVGVAYLLWFFMGLFGGHRFYVGKIGTACVMAVLSITVVGLIVTVFWWLIDALLLTNLVEEFNLNKYKEANAN